MDWAHLPRTVAAALVSLAVLAACTQDGQPQPDETPSQPADGSPEASDGQEVSVAEEGLTATTDSEGEPMVSYAVIVDNPSHDVATQLQLDVQIEDENGDPIKDLVTDKDVNTTTLQFIAPGEQQAVSGRTYVEKDGAESISVELNQPTWYPGDDDRFQDIAVTDLQADVNDDALELDFVVTSAYEKELEPAETYAVFRNDSGDIVGGSSTNDVSNHRYSPGETDTEIEITAGLPPDIDDSAIDVYVNPAIEGLN